jgi:hypothetical protein
MRVVERGGAGDCLFLVFAFFMHFSIPEFRLEVISEDVLLTDDLPLTWPSRTCKNLARTTWTEY